MTSAVQIEVPSPLDDCFMHSETICVRECCGIDAISDDPALVAAWGREEGCQSVSLALAQIEALIVQVQDRPQDVSSDFLNACTDGGVGRRELLSFLQKFQAALGDYERGMESLSGH